MNRRLSLRRESLGRIDAAQLSVVAAGEAVTMPLPDCFRGGPISRMLAQCVLTAEYCLSLTAAECMSDNTCLCITWQTR